MASFSPLQESGSCRFRLLPHPFPVRRSFPVRHPFPVRHHAFRRIARMAVRHSVAARHPNSARMFLWMERAAGCTLTPSVRSPPHAAYRYAPALRPHLAPRADETVAVCVQSGVLYKLTITPAVFVKFH